LQLTIRSGARTTQLPHVKHLAMRRLFMLVLWTLAWSVTYAATGHTTRGRFRSSLSRRSMRQKPPLRAATDVRLFDAAFAVCNVHLTHFWGNISQLGQKQELRSLLSKYEQAAKVLAGVGLHAGPELLHPFPINNVLRPHGGDSRVAADDVPLIPPFLTETTAILPLTDDMDGTLDVLYYGPLEFGTPPQRLTVDIDTGSADLWVPGDQCRECSNNAFVPTKSLTFNSSSEETFRISYVCRARILRNILNEANGTREPET
jgi:Eukaryotic aspartyl protease